MAFRRKLACRPRSHAGYSWIIATTSRDHEGTFNKHSCVVTFKRGSPCRCRAIPAAGDVSCPLARQGLAPVLLVELLHDYHCAGLVPSSGGGVNALQCIRPILMRTHLVQVWLAHGSLGIPSSS